MAQPQQHKTNNIDTSVVLHDFLGMKPSDTASPDLRLSEAASSAAAAARGGGAPFSSTSDIASGEWTPPPTISFNLKKSSFFCSDCEKKGYSFRDITSCP